MPQPRRGEWLFFDSLQNLREECQPVFVAVEAGQRGFRPLPEPCVHAQVDEERKQERKNFARYHPRNNRGYAQDRERCDDAAHK